MRDFITKLLGAVVCWGLLFLFWEHRITAVPLVRAWISSPVTELKNTLDKRLSLEQRLHLSYLIPGIYAIDYVCAEVTHEQKITRTILAGDTLVRQNSKARDSIHCSNGLILVPADTVELSFVRANGSVALSLKNGSVAWSSATTTSNPLLSIVLSYLTLDVQSLTPKTNGVLTQELAGRLLKMRVSTPIALEVIRRKVPSFSSPPLEVTPQMQNLTFMDFGQKISVEPRGAVLFSAHSAQVRAAPKN